MPENKSAANSPNDRSVRQPQNAAISHRVESKLAPRMDGNKRAGFYSVCYSCGWVGPTRSTLTKATTDAHYHRQDALDGRLS